MLISITQCLSETTAHGIPRIVSGENVRRRILWSVLCLGGMGGFVFHFSLLLQLFFSEPTSVSMVPNGIRFENPDIHFCNEITFSNSYALKPDPKHKAAKAKLNTLTKSLGSFLNGKEMINRDYWQTLWQTFPIDLLFSAFGHRIHQSFVRILDNADYDVNNVIANVTVMPHWRHLNCFRLRPKKKDFMIPDSEITIYLFLDSSSLEHTNISVGGVSLNHIHFSNKPDPDKSSGFVIYFTPRGQYPTVDTPKIVATPGFLTTISLSMVRQKIVNKKITPCAEKDINVTYVDILKGPPATVTYERAGYDACLNAEFHRMTLKECGCYVHYYPITLEFHRKGYKKCFNVTQILLDLNITQNDDTIDIKTFLVLYNRLDALKSCVYKMHKNQAVLRPNCSNEWPCHRDYYIPSSTISKYMLSVTMPEVFKIMLGPIYRDRMAHNLTVPGWDPYYPDLKDKKSYYQTRENFAKVVINSAEIRSTLISEERTYVKRNLISDMGGILGFYMGISVLTVCEIFSIVFNTLEHFVFSKRKKGTVDAQETTSHVELEG